MKNTIIVSAALVLAVACKKDEKPKPVTPATYSSGVLISNEGPFASGSGTLSWYNNATNEVENNVFQQVNNVPIGNVFQSISVDHLLNRAYLVVNNSQKVIVTNLDNMTYLGEITGFSTPRYLHKTDVAKAYVTDWTSNTVAVVDLNALQITQTLAAGNGPERMLALGSRMYVSNSGGFGIDSTLTVINMLTDQVQGSIVVGHNPHSMVTDANGALWVLCSGYNDFANPANSTNGKLLKIDPTTGTIAQTYVFPSNSNHPTQLCRNAAGTMLYWLSNGYAGEVYAMNISAPQLPAAAHISGSFYALNVDPVSDEIYTTDALDFQQDGILRRYLNDGTQTDSVRVGLIPGGIIFN